jgi:hypothetical protein
VRKKEKRKGFTCREEVEDKRKHDEEVQATAGR